uniref:Uncharacterized protein n=1 Tax=viral metagenome TaxID=1070528 RepID=A0A6C0II31_9ZZZZ
MSIFENPVDFWEKNKIPTLDPFFKYIIFKIT